jgi:O-antigen/teichoic acid export membrane protein
MLGADGFGKINFAQALLMYFMLLTHPGLTILGIQGIARNRERVRQYVNNILALRLTLAAVSFTLLVGLTFLADHETGDIKVLVILFGLTLFPSALLLDWVFKGTESMALIGIAEIGRAVVFTGLVVLFIKGSADILWAPIALFASSAAMAGLMAVGVVRNYGWFTVGGDLAFWKKLFVEAVPLGLSFIMIQIYYNIDTVMLGFMKSNDVVGWYNAAHRPILLAIGFVGLVGESVFPQLSRLALGPAEKTRNFLGVLSKGLIYMALPMVIGGVLLADKVIVLLYGVGYEESVRAFQLLIWQVFTVFANVPFAYSLLAYGKSRLYMYSVAAGAVVNIVLNVALIPRYSLVGAAVATIVAEVAVVSLLYVFAFYTVARVSVVGPLLKAAAGCGIMALVLSVLLDVNVAVSLGGAVGAYVLVLVLVRGFTVDEVRWMWASLR